MTADDPSRMGKSVYPLGFPVGKGGHSVSRTQSKARNVRSLPISREGGASRCGSRSEAQATVYLTAISSRSKISVAFGGITPP
jgi:hypothetical protein